MFPLFAFKGEHLYFKTKKGEHAYACIHPFCNLEQQLCQRLHYCSLPVHTNFSNNFCSCWLIIWNYDTMSIGTEKKTSLKLYWGLFLFYFYLFIIIFYTKYEIMYYVKSRWMKVLVLSKVVKNRKSEDYDVLSNFVFGYTQ
jgi:hypothetical protein